MSRMIWEKKDLGILGMATTGSPQGLDGPFLTLVIMTMVRTFFRETFPDQLGYRLHTQGAVLHSLSSCQLSQVKSIGLRH